MNAVRYAKNESRIGTSAGLADNVLLSLLAAAIPVVIRIQWDPTRWVVGKVVVMSGC